MKKTILSLAAMIAMSSAFATHPGTPVVGTVSVTGTGSNTVTSSTAAGSYVLGAGSSRSTASNTQTATTYVGGTGSIGVVNASRNVSLDDCVPTVRVNGVLTTGNVSVFGGTSATGSSTASNVSTGAGVGGAQAVGSSIATVAGRSTLTSPNMNLTAEGSAFSGVITNTGVVGTNGTGASSGATSSSFRADAHGSLFTFNRNGVAGDVKSITSNTYTRVGGIPTVTSGGCGTSVCTTGPSVVNNAVVEGGATANAGGTITANIVLKP